MPEEFKNRTVSLPASRWDEIDQLKLSLKQQRGGFVGLNDIMDWGAAALAGQPLPRIQDPDPLLSGLKPSDAAAVRKLAEILRAGGDAAEGLRRIIRSVPTK